jgi:uncharacterized protein (TIGR02246 family)
MSADSSIVELKADGWNVRTAHLARPSNDRNGSRFVTRPRPTTPVKRTDPGHEVEVYEGSSEAGVLYDRACPSIRRAAVATPRRETRKSMTSMTIGSKADQQAVLGVLKGVYEAWEANDAEAFVADYLDDASVVQPGVYKKDRQEIQSTMGGAFAGPLKGSRVIDQPRDVRFPNEDTAIVISEGGIIFPGQNAVPNEGMVRATWVLAKRDGRWLVAAYHYSAAT